ncbi:hypothetical protein J3R83DRAFT_10763 [Lanmaoa asiatica]|nr:hypothetical protein J3R83DRAFT_10763 [Lanmaoa asiatica]
MSQCRSEKASESSAVARNDSSLLIQEKLTARQARRAAKAAERREKSDTLKEEGDAFFHRGNFQDALHRYQQAIDVHGPSAKPLLLTNLAATYLKLGMYSEAHDAAKRALVADPTSVEARYHRGMARKAHGNVGCCEYWYDFRTLLALDPRSQDAQAELAFVEEMRCDPLHCEEEGEDTNSYSDYEAPALGNDPQLWESLSESSDCEHTGNGIPCKFYNRTECNNGHACRFSHAPDNKSERDTLWGTKRVPILLERCVQVWRTLQLLTLEGVSSRRLVVDRGRVDKEKKRCDKAIADYNNLAMAPGTGQTSKKWKQKRDPRSGFCGSESGAATARNQSIKAQSASGIEQSSRNINTKNKKRPAPYSYPNWGGYDSDGDEGIGMCGFTNSQVEELVCHGVKPWDDDAWLLDGRQGLERYPALHLRVSFLRDSTITLRAYDIGVLTFLRLDYPFHLLVPHPFPTLYNDTVFSDLWLYSESVGCIANNVVDVNDDSYRSVGQAISAAIMVKRVV